LLLLTQLIAMAVAVPDLPQTPGHGHDICHRKHYSDDTYELVFKLKGGCPHHNEAKPIDEYAEALRDNLADRSGVKFHIVLKDSAGHKCEHHHHHRHHHRHHHPHPHPHPHPPAMEEVLLAEDGAATEEGAATEDSAATEEVEGIAATEQVEDIVMTEEEDEVAATEEKEEVEEVEEVETPEVPVFLKIHIHDGPSYEAPADKKFPRISRVVTHLLCHHHIEHSVPVPFYHEHHHHRLCRCECPSGTKRHERVCKKEKSHCHCHWGRKCYEYIQRERHHHKCHIKDLEKKVRLHGVPVPEDNYVDQDHKVHEHRDHKHFGPRVRVTVRHHGRDVIHETYSWKHFIHHRNEIINGWTFHHDGVYEIEMEAFDWANKPAVCHTKLVIRDGFHPRATKPCPKNHHHECRDKTHWKFDEHKHESCPIEWTRESWRHAVKQAKEYKEWIHSRENDKCGRYGLEHDCDHHRGDSALHFGHHAAHLHLGHLRERPSHREPWDLDHHDIHALKLHKASERSHHPHKHCTKCVSYGRTFGEWVEEFRCHHHEPFEKKCKVAKHHSKCHYEKCLRADAHTFFKAKIEISHKVRVETEALITEHFPLRHYNNNDQAHFRSKCDDPKKHCGRHLSIQYLVDKHAHFRHQFEHLFDGKHAHEFVKFRYKIGPGEWHNWPEHEHGHGHGHEHKHYFHKVVTRVHVEAVSQCGLVHEFKFDVFIHYPFIPPVCEALRRTMIYQATKPIKSEKRALWCNNRGSDFVEATFDFDTSALRLLPEKIDETDDSHIEFRHVQCHVSIDDTEPAELFKHPLHKSTVVRMAINLIKEDGDSVSNGHHKHHGQKIKFECHFSYKDEIGGHAVNRFRCPPVEFAMGDCENPGWDCPWGKCQRHCPANKPRPNQACNGHRIHKGKHKTHIEYPGIDVPCCQDCGATTCTKLADLPDDGIKICTAPVPHRPRSFMEELSQQSAQPVVAGAIVVVAVAIVGAVAFLVKKQTSNSQTVEQTDGYSPLL